VDITARARLLETLPTGLKFSSKSVPTKRKVIKYYNYYADIITPYTYYLHKNMKSVLKCKNSYE